MNDTLYQHGTLALLVPGLLKGTMTMGELLEHGNTGIGTGEGLDGELIILDGKPYQINGQGKIQVVPADFTVPFATIHQAEFTDLGKLTNLTAAEVYQQVAQQVQSQNTFFSLKITGTFQAMKTRAVNKALEPYQTLVEASQKQNIFTGEQVEGTLLSYYSPQVFDGASVAGFHSHFLAADHTLGGHILDFTLAKGQVSWQQFATLEQHLPVTDSAYMQHDFARDDVTSAIDQAER
ncbi:acetolactate decarboxylase [Bombilactobacillus folatiphilus]